MTSYKIATNDGTIRELTDLEYLLEFPPEPAPPPIDVNAIKLTRRQVRVALVMAGMDESEIVAAFDGIQDPTARAIAKIDWEDAPYFVRTYPLFDQMAPALGLTSEQVDAMFVQALGLPA